MQKKNCEIYTGGVQTTQLSALSPHSEKVLGSIPVCGEGRPVLGSYALPVHVWVRSGQPQTKIYIPEYPVSAVDRMHGWAKKTESIENLKIKKYELQSQSTFLSSGWSG